MMLKWTRVLPYFVVAYLVKKFGTHTINSDELGKCVAWRVGDGEWLVWSQQNYDRLREARRKTEKYNELVKEEAERKKYEELKQKFESGSGEL